MLQAPVNFFLRLIKVRKLSLINHFVIREIYFVVLNGGAFARSGDAGDEQDISPALRIFRGYLPVEEFVGQDGGGIVNRHIEQCPVRRACRIFREDLLEQIGVHVAPFERFRQTPVQLKQGFRIRFHAMDDPRFHLSPLRVVKRGMSVYFHTLFLVQNIKTFCKKGQTLFFMTFCARGTGPLPLAWPMLKRCTFFSPSGSSARANVPQQYRQP